VRPDPIVVHPTNDPEEFAGSLLPASPLLRVAATGRHFEGSAKIVPLGRVGLFLPKLSFARVQKQVVESLFTLNLPLDQLPLDCRIDGRYQRIESGKAYFAGPGSEIDLRTEEGAGSIALNIDAELLRSHWLGPEDSAPSGEPSVISLDNPAGRALFAVVSSVWGQSFARTFTTTEREDFEDEIAAALARSLAPDLHDCSRVRNASRTMRRAKAYIRARLGDRLSVPDIAVSAGVTNRTLHRVFLQTEGLSPMQFVTRERLNAVRRVLFVSDPREMTVTEAALDHGFAHLGRFSQLYAKAFGARPSTTLNS